MIVSRGCSVSNLGVCLGVREYVSTHAAARLV